MKEGSGLASNIPSPLPWGEGGELSDPGKGAVRAGSLRCYTLRMPVPTARVRELRHSQTEAEKAAWYLLRGRRLGAKFRRQCRISNWVVDFYCFEHRLAVELEGGVHSQPSQMQRDAAKEDYFRTIGIRLLSVPDGLVLEDPEGFVRKVREQIGR